MATIHLKIGQKLNSRLGVHETLILEVIFVTFTYNPSVLTSDTQSCSEISTPPEIDVEIHFYAQHGTKSSLVFLPADRETSCWSPYYRVVQCNQKTPIPVLPRSWISSVKAKKGQALTLITATTSIHLPKPVSTDLTTKSDSTLTNPIEKDGVQDWSM